MSKESSARTIWDLGPAPEFNWKDPELAREYHEALERGESYLFFTGVPLIPDETWEYWESQGEIVEEGH